MPNVEKSEEVEYKPSIYVDLKSAEDVEGLEIGQEVTVLMKGTIQSIRMDKEDASLALEDFEVEVTKPNVFAELADA